MYRTREMTKPSAASFKGLGAEMQERRRRILLDSARRVLTREGIRGATLRQIAREADVTTGAIYHYFKSQDQLFASLYADSVDEALEKLANARRYQMAVSQASRVRALVTDYLTYLIENAWTVDIVVHNVFGEAFDEEAKAVLEDASLKLAVGFTQLLMPDESTHEDTPENSAKAAQVLWALLNGLVGIYRLSKAEQKPDIEKLVHELAEFAVARLMRPENGDTTSGDSR